MNCKAIVELCNHAKAGECSNEHDRISASPWAEIRTAYASGIGLRELARNMGIPAGTILAHAKREGWTQQIAAAKLIQRPDLARELAKNPMQSAAISVSDRKAQLLTKTLRVADKAIDHMDDQIDTANISQATIAFGVSTEKALLLAGEPTHHMSISFDPVDLVAELRQVQASIIEAVSDSAPALQAIEAEVVLPAPAAWD